MACGHDRNTSRLVSWISYTVAVDAESSQATRADVNMDVKVADSVFQAVLGAPVSGIVMVVVWYWSLLSLPETQQIMVGAVPTDVQ